ncbi:MAG TPA: hypothetical protein VKB52_10765 [Rhodanobacteraceae bacterium]|nr:hypothetical protein [Rhodanobacteraceae bacterium]
MTVAFALTVCVSGLAFAKEHYREGSVKADTKEAFETLAAGVRKEMQPGGKYEYIKPDEAKTVDKKLDEMDKLFIEKGTVAAMREEEKIALFNAQETVNSILTLRDRDRVICKKEAPVGSHIPVTTCHTYAQEVEAREGTKKIMDDWGRPLCVGNSPACAGK